jgi:hypothetical protein
MRHALPLVLFLSGALAVAIACGSSSDSNGSSGGAGDDASSGGTSGGPGDDGSSGGPGDGSSGGGDATQPPFSCAKLTPAPKLCEDFDDNRPPAASVTDTGAGASQGIVDTVSVSPPRSYETKVPAIPSQIAYALLETPFTTATPPTKFTVSFDFRPEAAVPATGTLVIARVFLSQTHAVSIELTSEDGPVIREQEGGPPPTLNRASSKIAVPAASAWTHYKLTIDLAGGKGTNATLEANGAALGTFALTGTTNSDFFALNLGLQADAAFTAHYDNLVVDY